MVDDHEEITFHEEIPSPTIVKLKLGGMGSFSGSHCNQSGVVPNIPSYKSSAEEKRLSTSIISGSFVI